eukprot:CAMPEP_0184025134 /NCGR_PEP_ID=MMETSP0954-20121128/12583_1 /TAXON_ID=627963 /ORGANISM="Aplanochytrium sp, Strain PBS07" /LENGTH=355 /DNA_ID=CAMNT_0026308767 /DNA_START=553 /DNA_END=1620 /DNA_ORIENTATION=-
MSLWGNFTALISFDHKKEEFTGRGVATSTDPKFAFESLKTVVREYQQYCVQNRLGKPDSKRGFWKGLYAYCQRCSSAGTDNWALVFWAGYPLYQIPNSNEHAKLFLSRMNTAIVDNEARNYDCTISHKQLHDMVNKQFQKFANIPTPRNADGSVRQKTEPNPLQYRGWNSEVMRVQKQHFAPMTYYQGVSPQPHQSPHTTGAHIVTYMPAQESVANMGIPSTQPGQNLQFNLQRNSQSSMRVFEPSPSFVQEQAKIVDNRKNTKQFRIQVKTPEGKDDDMGPLRRTVAALKDLVDKNVDKLVEKDRDWLEQQLQETIEMVKKEKTLENKKKDEAAMPQRKKRKSENEESLQEKST